MYLFENVNSFKKNQFKMQKTLESMHTVATVKLYDEEQKNNDVHTAIVVKITLHICRNSLNRKQEMEREDLFMWSCLITFII